ncbi:family S53 protease [Mycena amicta]|nr:family S53 protease [Mycena amicta]
MSFSALFIASLLSLAAAKPAFKSFVTQESLRSAPAGFTKLGVAADSQSLNLRIALPSKDFAGLQKTLLDVSTPSSPNYGNHLSKAEVNAFLAPSDEAVATVQAWLASHDLVANTSSSAGDWLSLTVPVSKANELFSAKYENFAHTASGKTYARTLSYSLPAEVADFITHVHPTTTFNNPKSFGPVISTPKAGVVSDATAASCASTITPACLPISLRHPQDRRHRKLQQHRRRWLHRPVRPYRRPQDLPQGLPHGRVFLDHLHTCRLSDGGSNPQSASKAGIEANLDIQYTVGIATGVPVFFVSVGDSFNDGDLEGFLDIVNFLSDEDDVPQVMTTSYGENETDMSKALAFKLCEAYAAFGARVAMEAWRAANPNLAPSTRLPSPQDAHSSQPSAPHTASPLKRHRPFLAVASPTIGVLPDYQADAVAAFLKAQGTTNKGLFNASGRGYPDVSAQGENVQIVSGGTKEGVDGTSCSSPIFASVIGLINDQLIAAGNPPLGFLNPWLYANPDMLNDVTTGSNPGCSAKGFSAVSGWDAVTGLGTPNYKKMLAAAGL